MSRKKTIAAFSAAVIIILLFSAIHSWNSWAFLSILLGQKGGLEDFPEHPFLVTSAEFKWLGEEIEYTYKIGSETPIWSEKKQTWVATWGFYINLNGEYINCFNWKYWNTSSVDGREALVILVPANAWLMLGMSGKENIKGLKLGDNIWLRASFRFLNGSMEPVQISGPNIIIKMTEVEGISFPSIFLVMPTERQPSGLRQHVMYVWNESEWYTITVRYENTLEGSYEMIRKHFGRSLDEIFIRLTIQGWFERFNKTMLIAVGADTKAFKPSTVFAFEIFNNASIPIKCVKVRVGEDEIYAALESPIMRGGSRRLEVAPLGNFTIGESYDITLIAIYEDGRAASETLKVNLIDQG